MRLLLLPDEDCDVVLYTEGLCGGDGDGDRLLTPEPSSGEIMLRSLSEEEDVKVPLVKRLDEEFCVSGNDNSFGDCSESSWLFCSLTITVVSRLFETFEDVLKRMLCRRSQESQNMSDGSVPVLMHC